MRQMQGGGGRGGAMSFGKSKAKMQTEDQVKVTFKDVAGVEEAKEEVKELVDFLRDPAKFQNLGGNIPRGVLMSGSPGTGKTLLARAIAGEAKVPFFTISGSDFVEMFVGVGASRVRDMFETAKKNPGGNRCWMIISSLFRHITIHQVSCGLEIQHKGLCLQQRGLHPLPFAGFHPFKQSDEHGLRGKQTGA